MKARLTLCQSGEPPTWRAEYLTFDKREWGVYGVRMAAKALWPELAKLMTPEGRVRLAIYGYEPPRFKEWKEPGWMPVSGVWDLYHLEQLPRPLMTTAGYAMNWYPEYNLLVYVNDWEK